MKARPLSISIIGWLLIVLGSISLIASLVMMGNPTVKEYMQKIPVSIPVQYTIHFVSQILLIISGIGLLKGKNWARILYIIIAVLGLTYSIIISTPHLTTTIIPKIVFAIILIFFLYRPAANTFFAEKK